MAQSKATIERQQALHQFRRQHLEQQQGSQWVPKPDRVTEWALLEITEILSAILYQLVELNVRRGA